MPLVCRAAGRSSVLFAIRRRPCWVRDLTGSHLVSPYLEAEQLVGAERTAVRDVGGARPRAMSTLLMRGVLLRGSNVYQWPSRNASNQAAKSIGLYGGGTPMSPR